MSETRNIAAYTEPTPPSGYPAYVSINLDGSGCYTITVRARDDKALATMEIPVEQLESLATDITAELYRGSERQSIDDIIEHRIIRSPEAEAYWRERIAGELDGMIKKVPGWYHHMLAIQEAAAFVRGKTREG